MIVFNECRIDSERECLIVEASVENLDYYNDVYIDSLHIDTEETFVSSNSPSEKSIWHKLYSKESIPVDVLGECGVSTSEDCKCSNVFTSEEYGRKWIREYIPLSSLGNHIFFIYVTAAGNASSSISTAPCGLDEPIKMSIAVDLKPVYNTMMSYVKEVGNNCNINKGFIDSILKLKAFELALKTGNYEQAIDKWKLLEKNRNIPTFNNCGCNGFR